MDFENNTLIILEYLQKIKNNIIFCKYINIVIEKNQERNYNGDNNNNIVDV